MYRFIWRLKCIEGYEEPFTACKEKFPTLVLENRIIYTEACNIMKLVLERVFVECTRYTLNCDSSSLFKRFNLLLQTVAHFNFYYLYYHYNIISLA